jgi:hypothetical protein
MKTGLIKNTATADRILRDHLQECPTTSPMPPLLHNPPYALIPDDPTTFINAEADISTFRSEPVHSGTCQGRTSREWAMLYFGVDIGGTGPC